MYTKDGKTLIQYAIGKTATSFVVPNGVTSISDSAFSNCKSLTNIEVPDSVTSIGYWAFYDCNNLTSVIFEDTEGWKTDYTNISSADLEDAGTAAYYLAQKYLSYWTKQYTLLKSGRLNGLPLFRYKNYDDSAYSISAGKTPFNAYLPWGYLSQRSERSMQKVEICGVDTAGLPKLSNKENEELMKRIKAGDKAARDTFIVGNMRLVLSLVKRFRIKNLGADDVFQAGCVGLIKAIDGFDTSVGVKFSTYAVPMIVGEIKRYLRDGNSLRVSRSIRDMAYKVLKAREAIESDDEEATTQKIAERLQVAEREVVYALDAISDPVSIYEPVYNKSGDTLLLMDQLCDEKNTDEIWTEHVALSEAIGKLGERERKILYLRYYQGKTQTEISEEVGISQAQVSRLEKNALQAIKKNIS